MSRYYVRWKLDGVSYEFEYDGSFRDLWEEAIKLVKNGRRSHIKCRYIVHDNMTGEKLFYVYSRRASNGRWIAKLCSVGRYGRYRQNMFF